MMTGNELPENRKHIIAKRTYKDDIEDYIKELDLDNINFDENQDLDENRSVNIKVVEGQKTYFWIRLFLKEECESLKPEDIICVKYGTENLEIKYICYAKKGSEKDRDEDITNYNSEDDKKVLCLMVDSERINRDNKDIPFLKTMFRISKWYEYQMVKREDIQFIHKETGKNLDYFNVNW